MCTQIHIQYLRLSNSVRWILTGLHGGNNRSCSDEIHELFFNQQWQWHRLQRLCAVRHVVIKGWCINMCGSGSVCVLLFRVFAFVWFSPFTCWPTDKSNAFSWVLKFRQKKKNMQMKPGTHITCTTVYKHLHCTAGLNTQTRQIRLTCNNGDVSQPTLGFWV